MGSKRVRPQRGTRNRHGALGAEGETRAATFLARRGYLIIDRNVRAGGVEIDLVATRRGVVAFVEVKTRRSHRFGSPEDAVDGAKQARLARGAAVWLATQRRRFRGVRFDVIACQVDADADGRQRWSIRHVEDAFTPGE